MQPHKYFQKFVAAVVKRSGVCRATVEAVLPAVFDEIRYQLTEGTLCVPIESLGTFAVIDRPEHEYLYNRNNANRICTVAAQKVIKFKPTRNMRNEVNAGRFDPTRRSFVHHPQDPVIRQRRDLRYRPAKKYNREDGASARPIYKRKESDTDRTDGTDFNMNCHECP